MQRHSRNVSSLAKWIRHWLRGLTFTTKHHGNEKNGRRQLATAHNSLVEVILIVDSVSTFFLVHFGVEVGRSSEVATTHPRGHPKKKHCATLKNLKTAWFPRAWQNENPYIIYSYILDMEHGSLFYEVVFRAAKCSSCKGALTLTSSLCLGPRLHWNL